MTNLFKELRGGFDPLQGGIIHEVIKLIDLLKRFARKDLANPSRVFPRHANRAQHGIGVSIIKGQELRDRRAIE